MIKCAVCVKSTMAATASESCTMSNLTNCTCKSGLTCSECLSDTTALPYWFPETGQCCITTCTGPTAICGVCGTSCFEELGGKSQDYYCSCPGVTCPTSEPPPSASKEEASIGDSVGAGSCSCSNPCPVGDSPCNQATMPGVCCPSGASCCDNPPSSVGFVGTPPPS